MDSQNMLLMTLRQTLHYDPSSEMCTAKTDLWWSFIKDLYSRNHTSDEGLIIDTFGYTSL
jgi:hypothetical protein